MQASKEQASNHVRNGQNSQLRPGASDSAEILVDETYECEGQSDKI